MDKTIKIFNWNVNGLRAILKKDIIPIDNVNFIDFIEKNDYTIVSLQEVKLSENNKQILDSILLKYPYRYSSLTHNSRSGVVVFSKIKAKKVIYDINQKDLRFKGRVITLEFDKFYYTNVYQPNSGEHLKNLSFRNQFDIEFKKCIRNLLKKKEVVISGDFNAVNDETGVYDFKRMFNKAAGVSEIEINNFNSLLKDLELYVATSLNVYTYFSYRFNARPTNRGMRLDYIVLSKGIKKIKSNVLEDVYGSDHLAMTCTFKV